MHTTDGLVQKVGRRGRRKRKEEEEEGGGGRETQEEEEEEETEGEGSHYKLLVTIINLVLRLVLFVSGRVEHAPVVWTV